MDELYFSVKTGLKDIIGKDLITDDNIAIFELVKNSYDARANDVVITFENNKIIYYLNRSAKFNFTNRMKIEPVNYGSIFLFKNGFRVQPYGNTGDDSWGLDFRAQQGRATLFCSRFR